MNIPDPANGDTPLGLRLLASKYAQQAGKEFEDSQTLGRRHRRTYFGVAILGVIAGVVAGVAGIAEGAPVVTGIAGFAASALVGVHARLDAEALSRFHFIQAAGYAGISRLFEIRAEGPEEPTQAQISELVERLMRWQARTLNDQTIPSDSHIA